MTAKLFLLYTLFAITGGLQNAQAQAGDDATVHLGITSLEEIGEIEAVQQAFNAAARETASCINGDVSRRQGCICEHKKVWGDVDLALTAMLKAHPQWKDRFLDYQEGVSAAGVSVSLLTSTLSGIQVAGCP